jgi:cupin 2 domain-containing protein
LPDARAGEAVTMLCAGRGVRIERIVSLGQASPPGFWYDQDEAEWVLLVAGKARLLFADEAAPRRLVPGDFVEIAPHRRHRIEWTDPAEPTVWLAVFFDPVATNAPQPPANAGPSPGSGPGPALSPHAGRELG